MNHHRRRYLIFLSSSPPNHHLLSNSTTDKMVDASLKPAILIASDTASQDPSSDKTVDVLLSSFAASTWEPPVTKIVPDNVLDIQRTICNWTDGPDWFNLILVSGGTGFAVKDNTPEVGYAIICSTRARD